MSRTCSPTGRGGPHRTDEPRAAAEALVVAPSARPITGPARPPPLTGRAAARATGELVAGWQSRETSWSSGMARAWFEAAARHAFRARSPAAASLPGGKRSSGAGSPPYQTHRCWRCPGRRRPFPLGLRNPPDRRRVLTSVDPGGGDGRETGSRDIRGSVCHLLGGVRHRAPAHRPRRDLGRFPPEHWHCHGVREAVWRRDRSGDPEVDPERSPWTRRPGQPASRLVRRLDNFRPHRPIRIPCRTRLVHTRLQPRQGDSHRLRRHHISRLHPARSVGHPPAEGGTGSRCGCVDRYTLPTWSSRMGAGSAA